MHIMRVSRPGYWDMQSETFRIERDKSECDFENVEAPARLDRQFL